MRTSHLSVRKMILQEKSKITDEQFFTSREYRAYLTDISEAATRRYHRPLPVTVVADHDSEVVAYTDFQGVYINACNKITWSMPGRRLKSLSLVGFDSHENSHNLFTDYRIWNAFFKAYEKGRFYPNKPKKLTVDEKKYAEEIIQALKDTNDTVPARVIRMTAKSVSNILEDGFVDARYSHEFPGIPARGITLNNMRFAEQTPDIQFMLDHKYHDHNIVMNLLIQYVRRGEVNNLSGYRGELLDMMQSFIPLVDACVLEDDAKARCDAANRIVIAMWPLMQRCFDELRQLQKQAQQQASAGTSSEEENDQSNADKAGDQAVNDNLSAQLPEMPPNFTEMGKQMPCSGSDPMDAEQVQGLRMEASEALAEETARIALESTEHVVSTGNGTRDYNGQYEGSGYGNAASDIERVLDSMAENMVHEAMEEELSEELQREAGRIDYGDAHRNIDIVVNRMARVPDYLIDSYWSVVPPLLQLSKRLQKGVKPKLQDKRQGGKQTGLYMGKHLDQHGLYREDGRIFCNKRLPTEPINLAVALLVDESGSMCGEDRITRARATSIVVHDFCCALGIPVMITGHTAWNSVVELYSYAEFDSVDQNDRFRIMDMTSRECNRDGAALRFVAEKLNRYPADAKLLIVISDGQPNDDGYSGTAAEADLRGIKLEYSRKGIKIFAAAIGDDRDRIERIYGDGYLDITDLNRLPIILTNLISRSLPN